MNKTIATSKVHLQELIKDAFSKKIIDLNFIDTSQITDMSDLFSKTELDFNVSDWDVSNVTNMESMFYKANNFNQNISSWDVSKVTNMYFMFGWCVKFDQPIGEWDVSNVTDMSVMFLDTHFNQPLNNWDVSKVIRVIGMFSQNDKFDQPLDNWNVSKVTDMSMMFANSKKFNQDISHWDVSKFRTKNRGIFKGADSFDLKNVPKVFFSKYGASIKDNVEIDSVISDLIHTLDLKNIEIALGMAYGLGKLEETKKYTYNYLVEQNILGKFDREKLDGNQYDRLIENIGKFIESLA